MWEQMGVVSREVEILRKKQNKTKGNVKKKNKEHFWWSDWLVGHSWGMILWALGQINRNLPNWKIKTENTCVRARAHRHTEREKPTTTHNRIHTRTPGQLQRNNIPKGNIRRRRKSKKEETNYWYNNDWEFLQINIWYQTTDVWSSEKTK